MKLRRGQKIAKEVLAFDFEVVNRKKEALNRFKKGDVVVPSFGNNFLDYGIVEDIDDNISKVMVNYDGNIKQCDPDEIRVFVLSKQVKTARRVKRSL